AKHGMTRVYVSGHRNPDTDSIGAAIGYAELKNRLDEDGTEYVAVRLGTVNSQTEWLLRRSGAPLPRHLPHAYLRVRDVMRTTFPIAHRADPVRTVGLLMALEGMDLVPVVDDDGVLTGLLTERGLARRYVRESREASRLDVPTPLRSMVEVLDGELQGGDPDVEIKGRVWVQAMHSTASSKVQPGDVVVIGDRPEAITNAIRRRIALLVLSNSVRPDDEMLELAAEHDTCVVTSPLDSYVTSRMITLSEPCRALAETDPLTVGKDDLVRDIADQIKDVHYRAVIAVDRDGKPVGVVTRSDLVNPKPRRLLLVDHGERGQSVPGIEEAEIVEILDHHHIGSIETKLPVTAIFDPVGSTSTLVVERFRQAETEPAQPTATMLLGAILSDTVLLTSPTTTERDHAVTGYLEELLSLDAQQFGREMFEHSSDVADVSASDLVRRDLKEYELDNGKTLSVAQIETVGRAVFERSGELRSAAERRRARHGDVMFAVMLTDILAQHTRLLVTGNESLAERAFGEPVVDGAIELEGVMSRKKQVAPGLLAAASG
ncbi:MAG TPA: putative manganese-dependent inorganic diphosphatase, partial [Solirubrobacteraceae bacterium]|nr:putative manganese-dependent inorganic diphosphatase [Solirubrobacteraceae bacterium]